MSLQHLTPWRWACDTEGCEKLSPVVHAPATAAEMVDLPSMPSGWERGQTIIFPDGLIKGQHFCPGCAGKPHPLPKHARVIE